MESAPYDVLSKPQVTVDAGVWLDYYTDRLGTAHMIAMLFDEIDRRGGMTLTSVITVADVFSSLSAYLRDEVEGAGQEANRAACSASAWGCIRQLRERSVVVGADLGDCLEAEYLRQMHDDFKDDLVIAAAKRGKANAILTNNEELLRHAPIISISVERLHELLVLGRGSSDVDD